MKIGPLDLVKAVISYMIALLIIVLTPRVASSVERTFFPITKNMTIVDHYWDGGTYFVQVVGLKSRDCNRSRGPEGFAIVDGLLSEVELTFPGDPSPGSSRPTGWQSFGIWAFDLSSSPNAESVVAYVWHNCNVFYTTETVIGPWPVLRKEAVYD